MAPVVKELERHRERITSVVCATAQHREMLDQVLRFFDIEPQYDLGVMGPGQTPSQVAAAVLARLEPILTQERPDWVLVQGDTTTALSAALGAFYAEARVGHVEAGLRTFDKARPFPEEANRVVTDALADLCFAPTSRARENLLREGVTDSAIRVTGNTGIDALLHVASRSDVAEQAQVARLPRDRRLILVTAHRRESFGAPLRSLCEALRELAQRFAGDVHLVYPVHPNENVATPVREALGGIPNLTLIEPLEYGSLVHLMQRCVLVLTDSGGIQEEAPTLGVPVLVLRDASERPEGMEAGVARLVGTDRGAIVSETSRLLEDGEAHAQMARAVSPYGDGRAAERIVAALLDYEHSEVNPPVRGIR